MTFSGSTMAWKTTFYLLLCSMPLLQILPALTTEEPPEIEETYPVRRYGFLYYWDYTSMMTEEPPEMKEDAPYGTGGVTEVPRVAIGATPTEEPPEEYYYSQAVTPVENLEEEETEEPPEENTQALQTTGITETEEPPEIENEVTPSGSQTEDPDIDVEEHTTPPTIGTRPVTQIRALSSAGNFTSSKAAGVAAAHSSVIKTRPSENVTETVLLRAILGISENKTLPLVRDTAVDQPKESVNSTSEI